MTQPAKRRLPLRRKLRIRRTAKPTIRTPSAGAWVKCICRWEALSLKPAMASLFDDEPALPPAQKASNGAGQERILEIANCRRHRLRKAEYRRCLTMMRHHHQRRHQLLGLPQAAVTDHRIPSDFDPKASTCADGAGNFLRQWGVVRSCELTALQ